MAIKFGSSGGEPLKDTAFGDLIISLGGNDTITGSKGIDFFFTGYGDDRVTVGTGSTAVDGGEGNDTVTAGAGSWVLSLPGAFQRNATAVDLATGRTIGLTNVETVKLGSQTFSFKFGTDVGNKINGTSGADYVIGRDGADTITTGAGNDRISSGNGADTVDAGDGDDIVDDSMASIGQNFFQPKSATDTEKNVFKLGAGNDLAILRSDPDFSANFFGERESYDIDGGTGADAVVLSGWALGALAQWEVAGGAIVVKDFLGKAKTFATLNRVEQVVDLFGDRVWSQATNSYNRLTASKTGTALSEIVTGGAGGDTLKGGGGFDYFTGGKGTDTVELSGRSELWSGAFTGDLVQTKNGFTGARLDNTLESTAVVLNADIEKIRFTSGQGSADDTLFDFRILKTGDVGKAGTGGNDFLVETAGKPTDAGLLKVGNGADHVIGQGSVKTVDGGAGDDVIQWQAPAAKATFLGGTGNDRITVINTAEKPVAITVNGGDGDDQINYSGPGTLSGGAGDDQIGFGAGATALGGEGNDILLGFASAGTAIGKGGAGDDAFLAYDFSTDYNITATAKGITLVAKSGGRIELSEVEALKFGDVAIDVRAGAKSFASFNGGATAEKRVGGSGIDLMNGGAGGDSLGGGGGNDVLAGDAGNDALAGGAGDDVLDGGAGADTLTGGAGFDTFLFLARGAAGGFGADKVLDFQAGKGLGDVLAFSESNAAYNSFEDLMKHAVQTSAGTVITLDEGMSVTLSGVAKSTLTADDFIFV